MAFPVPDHLPKRPVPVDVSSEILYKIDAATDDTLNSSLASSWIRELDQSIRSTKQSIHDRIQTDIPKFREQLEASKSVQNRSQNLTNRVDVLKSAISHPETGILPTLIDTLSKHKNLAQEACDAEVVYESFSYLLRCRDAYSSLLSLAQAGRLPEANLASNAFQALMEDLPESLQKTHVMGDFKQKYRATKAGIEDQLGDAYSRSIVITPTEIIVHSPIQGAFSVRQSQTVVELSAVIDSLSPAALANHLITLRRDFLARFVDCVLKQPYSLLLGSSLNEEKLSLVPAPPNPEDLSSRLENLSQVLNFLSGHILAHFPSAEAIKFMRSLSKPVSTSVLQHLLLPALPSSFGLLPSFLEHLQKCVVFEEKDIGQLLSGERNECAIKTWSDGVSGHYERRRRIEILENARKEILQAEDSRDIFKAISNDSIETSIPSVVPIQDDDSSKDDAWGFDEPMSAQPGEEEEAEEDSWGLDGDLDVEPVPELEPKTEPSLSGKDEKVNGGAEPDLEDAWGWNEDEDIPDEEIPEDNPWEDDPWSDPPESELIPPPLANVSRPKAATRLEKLASKGKKHVNGNSSPTQVSPLSSPPIPQPPPIVTFSPAPELATSSTQSSRLNPTKRPADVVTTIAPKEYYEVPKQTRRITKMVDTVIDESKLFYASNLFPQSVDTNPAPGTILSQSAPSILDLYQALYPIKFADELASPERGMLFSNSCLYMIGSVQKIEDTLYGQTNVRERFAESRQHLQILSDSWFDITIERQQGILDKVLVDGASGFTYTGNQDQYDECEMALSQVVRDIKKLAQRLNGILAKSKYYTAIGLVTDAVLSRVLQDILALPDIPEVESHRLSELCRILNALEGLFSEDPTQPSFVVAYVPSWLKFSYLSELLEASLADITYLFEQGALVDFQVTELVNLVHALFADTALRTNTINKLLAGHPSPSE